MPRLLYTLPLTVFAVLSLAACATSGGAKSERELAPSTLPEAKAGFEAPSYVASSDFIPSALMRSGAHIVAPDAYNDGYANSYKITMGDREFIVQGTDKALQTIAEIHAVQILKQDSTAEVIGETVAGKMKGLITTPQRVIESGVKKIKDADTAADALMVIPSGLGSVLKNVGEGLYEVGKTGAALTQDGLEQTGLSGDAGCSGSDCLKETGTTARKGAEELSGAAAKARALHRSLGTDPYSDNAALQSQVRRIAYSETLSGLGLSAGLTAAGLPPAITILRSSVSAINRTESLIDYSDPYARRDAEKARVKTWGFTDAQIEQFYDNAVLTPTLRTQSLAVLETISPLTARRSLFDPMASAQTEFVARSHLTTLRYLAQQAKDIDNMQIVSGLPFTAFRLQGNRAILLITADYLRWTPELKSALERSAAQSDERYFDTIALHVIGRASPLAESEIDSMGIDIEIIPPAPYSNYGG